MPPIFRAKSQTVKDCLAFINLIGNNDEDTEGLGIHIIAEGGNGITFLLGFEGHGGGGFPAVLIKFQHGSLSVIIDIYRAAVGPVRPERKLGIRRILADYVDGAVRVEIIRILTNAPAHQGKYKLIWEN